MTDRGPLAEALQLRLRLAKHLAQGAGELLRRHAGQLTDYDEKSPIDLVTAADRASEAWILEELRAADLGDTVLAEERDGPEGAAALRDRVRELPWTWAIDPLDGTTNFAHGYPAWCASVGLLYYGRPVIGVVANPPRGEMFVGGAGIPATCNDRPIAVSPVATLSRALVVTGFPYDRRQRLPQLLGWLGAVLATAHCVRRSGSAATDLCDLAMGRSDGFYEIGLKPWDLTAGHAIVQAAGGQLSNFAGKDHDVFAASTVASNGRVHAELVDLLGAAGQKVPPRAVDQ
ncbi:MAG: inositol monophosphatase [Deltaproteobacteria bacterium]|nr:inositol monophosphatase [Deltaproteobacteria bacterium]